MSDCSVITDMELDLLVERVILLHPQSGEKTVSSQLRRQGYKIQREKVRESIWPVHRIGVELRSRRSCIEGFTMLSPQIVFGTWMVITN